MISPSSTNSTAVFSSYIEVWLRALAGRCVASFGDSDRHRCDARRALMVDGRRGGRSWCASSEKSSMSVAFAFIITNFSALSSIIFRSFAGLGLIAGGSSLCITDFLHPGRLAKVGVDAGSPLLAQVGVLSWISPTSS